ncbi:YdeI/OmpD-associated family protein [Paenibacillus sp. NPDC058177]|uniref:YdeI/OmpD-associated family protein n=1 Tax=Paenibacillus sp. NPDC058177 TaxID=3346369 RepID=UPI0036DF199D
MTRGTCPFRAGAFFCLVHLAAWIEGAKRQETRAARIEKSVGKLAEGLRLK